MQQQITHQLQVADTSVSGNAFAPSGASRTALTLAICAAISACGGGGSSSDDKDPVVTETPGAIKVEGIVAVDKTISKATVCIDLNQNKLCDTGEPKSAPTGVDGKYTIEYQPADTAAATLAKASQLLTILTDASTDAADPDHTVTDKTIVLTTPAGKTQINPLTTLVQAAVKSGMSLADAETAVAAQLLTDVVSLYDYQAEAMDATTGMPGNARLKAKVTAFALELGMAPVTLAANANGEALTQLSDLVYSDANNYSYRIRVNDGVVQPDGFTHQFESRAAKSGGVATTNNELLFPSVLLTSKGWTRCDSNVPRLVTRGTPWITQSCEKSTTTINFLKAVEDISGKKMSDVVTRMQQGDPELKADDIELDVSMSLSASVLGDAVFPAGSQLRTAVSPQITLSPAYINNTLGDRFNYPSLSQMIALRPASAVDLAAGAKTAVGGLGILDAQHLLRVAFIDDKTAQFFSCLSTPPAYTDVGVCTAYSKSGYTIEERNGVKLLTFSTFPNAGVKESRG